LVGPEPTGDDVLHAIGDAFERNAKLNAKGLKAETKGRSVTLKGTVSSWAEHDEAVAAAWAAPGVQHVDDRLLVAY
jgi:osmotically-inducible protein OsmY